MTAASVEKPVRPFAVHWIGEIMKKMIKWVMIMTLFVPFALIDMKAHVFAINLMDLQACGLMNA